MLSRCKMNWRRVIAAVFGAVCFAVLAQDVPQYHRLPKYQTPVPYAGVRNWHVTQNMGATGARVWVYGHRSNTSASRELMVKSVEPGSPADGVLKRYDFIIGAAVPPAVPSHQWKAEPAVKRFDEDARLSIARAVTWAESDKGGGKLKLLVSRAGTEKQVTVTIPVMGNYSPTAPFKCPKTTRIIDNAVAFLASHTPANGYAGMTGSLNAMLLLASHDPGFLDHVRRSACRMSVNHTINDAGHETWRWGYCNMFLAEYYLATGDERVLPTIAEYCDVLAKGQCNPGTWGHRAVPDFIPPGYGSMNQSGLVCFLSMALAKQCGVDVDEKALSNCIRFYGSFAGRGGVPYGDHPPHPDETGNGKNGSAAVAFFQLGAYPAAQWFARLCASTDLGSFEGGHTGNFFNQTWSPLGASLSGMENYVRFWERFNSYRDLARRWDGGFVTQPLPNTREGDLGTGNYVRKGPLWSTGGFTLSYLAKSKRLAVLGRRRSVFGANPPAALKPALALYREKKFEPCAAAAEKLQASEDATVNTMATQLATMARKNAKSLDLTLAEMKTNLAKKRLYELKWQLQAIESLVDADDPRLKDYRAAVEDPANEELLKTGAEYDRMTSGIGQAGLRGFEIYVPSFLTNHRWYGSLSNLASRGKEPYRTMAKETLKKYPQLNLQPDMALIPPKPEPAQRGAPKPEKPKCWRYVTVGKTFPKGWYEPTFDDGKWREVALPDRALETRKTKLLRGRFDVVDPNKIEELVLHYGVNGEMTVYLNGTLIMKTKGAGSGRSSAMIPLRPSTKELLRKTGNVLAVEAHHSPGKGDFALALWAK